MNSHLPGKLLKRKLSELSSALFFAEGDSLFKLQNHLITDMIINNDGEIWFVIPKPAQEIEAFDKEFPVRLEFFKKGIPFRLKVQGKGSIIGDRAEMEQWSATSEPMLEKVQHEAVIIVKVAVQFVDYAGNMSTSISSRLKLAGMQISGWLFPQSKNSGVSIE